MRLLVPGSTSTQCISSGVVPSNVMLPNTLCRQPGTLQIPGGVNCFFGIVVQSLVYLEFLGVVQTSVPVCHDSKRRCRSILAASRHAS